MTAEHQRRPRYSGTHPRRFEEKYKELAPEKYAEDVQKVLGRGQTPAGSHRPICVREVLETLDPKPGETGLDATLGHGGHAEELLRRVLPGGRLFGLDADPLELPKTEVRLRALGFDEQAFTARRLNFAGLLKLLPEAGGGFDFILADLGVSSMQLDNPARGFTFKTEGPLDLRLNPERGQSAAALLRTLSEEALAKLLRDNSDEPHAKAIAKAVFKFRQEMSTTTALADAVRGALATVKLADPERETTSSLQRVFQALRIKVNDEFSALEQLLRALPLALKPGGRVAIITFHSGEDGRVCGAFADGLAAGLYSSVCEYPIRASAQERHDNPRSKCAQLRWALRNG